MKLAKLCVLLASILVLADCQPSKGEKEADTPPAVPLKEALPGTWESVSVKVVVHTAEGTDTSYVFEVLEEEWPTRLGMKPIRTYFHPDNTYRQEFIDVTDKVINVARGMWNTFGDTLMLIEPDATYQYIITPTKGMAEFRAVLDWDGDGQEDDEYLGIHRRISMGVE